MPKQPTLNLDIITTTTSCPACSHPELRQEDAATGRHQCCRCGWRSIVDPQTGQARDWQPGWRKG